MEGRMFFSEGVLSDQTGAVGPGQAGQSPPLLWLSFVEDLITSHQ